MLKVVLPRGLDLLQIQLGIAFLDLNEREAADLMEKVNVLDPNANRAKAVAV